VARVSAAVENERALSPNDRASLIINEFEEEINVGAHEVVGEQSKLALCIINNNSFITNEISETVSSKLQYN
jgi:hypothetical protein